MRPWTSLPRPFLYSLALVFCLVTSVYSFLWIHGVRQMTEHSVKIGFNLSQLFYESTPDDRYATLFLAVYNDSTRQLEYTNCGHNAPLLFRANGSIECLSSTSTVVGLTPD